MTVQEAIKSLTVEESFKKHIPILASAYDVAIECMEEVEQYRALGTVEELKEAREFKKYFDELYGEGLEVANWHKNGDLEPFDSFYESALEFNWSDADDL